MRTYSSMYRDSSTQSARISTNPVSRHTKDEIYLCNKTNKITGWVSAHDYTLENSQRLAYSPISGSAMWLGRSMWPPWWLVVYIWLVFLILACYLESCLYLERGILSWPPLYISEREAITILMTVNWSGSGYRHAYMRRVQQHLEVGKRMTT
jgi:hypothetical protein